MISRLRASFVLAALVLALAAIAAAAADPVITYRKVFKGSTPEFIEISVAQSGKCTFDIRQLQEDPEPQVFPVSDALRARIFSLASELQDFRVADLDVHRKIANLGEKTFKYQNGAETHETSFNYTTNEAANQLYQIFEGLGRQQDHIVTLARRLKHDPLGLNDELMDLQKDYDDKLIPEPENLVPILQQIADDSRVIEVARSKARALIARIHGAK
jgi:hypothetical protein